MVSNTIKCYLKERFSLSQTMCLLYKINLERNDISKDYSNQDLSTFVLNNVSYNFDLIKQL